MYSSTCFGRPHVHHQELNNCSRSLWFYRWSVVVAMLLVVVRAGRPARPRPTALSNLGNVVARLRICGTSQRGKGFDCRKAQFHSSKHPHTLQYTLSEIFKHYWRESDRIVKLTGDEAKNEWIYTSNLTYVFTAWCLFKRKLEKRFRFWQTNKAVWLHKAIWKYTYSCINIYLSI